MKMRKILLTGLLTVASVLCLAACKKEEPKGRSEEEKQAITASMETGMDQSMFRMSLGHNIVVLRLNHPAVKEFMSVQRQYYEDLLAWQKEKKKNPDIPDLERPDDFLRISLISDLDASEFTQLSFHISDEKSKAGKYAYLRYTNADDSKFSNNTGGSKSRSIRLTYSTDEDAVRIVVRSPGYTMEQLENMQVLIETEAGIVGADADPAVDYNIPDDVKDNFWKKECKKDLSDFEYAKYLKNTTEDYQLVEESKRVPSQEVGRSDDNYVVTRAYYYDESGALVDADCLHYYINNPKAHANLYAGEDRDIGGVVGLYRSPKEIDEMLQSGRSKQSYLVDAIELDSSSYNYSYFSNPYVTSEQICNYGELGYTY